MNNIESLPKSTDFPPDTMFVIKESDVPLIQMPSGVWFNWFGGKPRPYDVTALHVDNNCQADSFEEWIRVVAESLKEMTNKPLDLTSANATRDVQTRDSK
jgi:hypothetical protein